MTANTTLDLVVTHRNIFHLTLYPLGLVTHRQHPDACLPSEFDAVFADGWESYMKLERDRVAEIDETQREKEFLQGCFN